MVTSEGLSATRPPSLPPPTKLLRTVAWPVCWPVMSALRDGAQIVEPA